MDSKKLTKSEIDSILNYDFLYQKYIVEELSTYEICALVNNIVKREKMRLRLIELGIPVRSRKQCKNTKSARDKMKIYLGSIETVNKRKDTCLKRYNKENPSQVKEFEDKKIQTCLRNRNVEHPFQSKDVYSKAIKTWKSIYGVDNPNKSSIVRNKTKTTCLDKYGCTASFMNPEIRSKFMKGNNGSKVSIKLFESVCSKFPELSENFHFKTHGDEILLNCKESSYFLDCSIVIGDVKLDIEFNGDFWHMNPSIYKENDKVPYVIDGRKIAKDVWNYDNKRKKEIEDQGYKVLVVWENEFKTKPQETIQKCCDFIKQYSTIPLEQIFSK